MRTRAEPPVPYAAPDRDGIDGDTRAGWNGLDAKLRRQLLRLERERCRLIERDGDRRRLRPELALTAQEHRVLAGREGAFPLRRLADDDVVDDDVERAPRSLDDAKPPRLGKAAEMGVDHGGL